MRDSVAALRWFTCSKTFLIQSMIGSGIAKGGAGIPAFYWLMHKPVVGARKGAHARRGGLKYSRGSPKWHFSLKRRQCC
jgi:hypothetical protein